VEEFKDRAKRKKGSKPVIAGNVVGKKGPLGLTKKEKNLYCGSGTFNWSGKEDEGERE